MKPRLLLPALCLLAACGSAPSRFYELTAEAPAAQPKPTSLSGLSATTVALGAIDLPGTLDRPQMVRRHGVNQLTYSEDERWAGPLDQMVRRALSDDLAARLPAGLSLIDPGSANPAARTVAIEVSRFDADDAGEVTLVARWSVLGPGGAVLMPPREATLVEPGGGADPARVALTMSRVLAALAAQIAAVLR